MKKLQLFLISLLCLSFYLLPSSAQLISEKQLEDRMAWKNASIPTSMLYIKTDKTIYLPTEVIWFAGYLLPYTVKNDTVNADMLSVSLFDE